MKILITTGIYPPKIGGPAQYAKNLALALEQVGNQVVVKTYTVEDKLPSGIRHLSFLLRIIPKVLWADSIITLDTFSVGLPTVMAAKIFGKKSIIRTGGDFLWEQYVERTGKKILLRKFYDTERANFNKKERIIFRMTRWTLANASYTVFSTDWQRNIFVAAYAIDRRMTSIIENYYGPKESDLEPRSKIFIASTRKLVWKNLDSLKRGFDNIQKNNQDIELFLDNLPFDQFMQTIKDCYATVLFSLGDISPNMILDAIRFNRPFICTREVGIYNRIKDAGIFVNPEDEKELEDAVRRLLTPEGYREAKEKVKKFDFTHTWEQMAKEFINLAMRI